MPHTWNTKRAPFVTLPRAWYRTSLSSEGPLAPVTYLIFEGVGTVAEVFMDGTRLGEHRGAYTRFVFDATSALAQSGPHVIAVRVDNTDEGTDDCLPRLALAHNYYKPYGGIYRKVRVLAADASHVEPMHGTTGVDVTSTDVSEALATLNVATPLRNTLDVDVDADVVHRVTAPDGTRVLEHRTSVRVARRGRLRAEASLRIERPTLWQLGKGALYRIDTEIEADGAVRDSVATRVGLRAWSFGPDGARLNGSRVALRGINKHQETEAHLAAVNDDELRAEWRTLQELGVNFVRLAHYPHAELELELADEMGVALWVENGFSTPGPWTATGDRITRDMVRQSKSHPSVMFYSVGNEVIDSRLGPEAQDAATRYAAAVKEEDATRTVVYANNADFFGAAPIDAVAHNVYPGWYGGTPWDFDTLASERKFISETGGRSVVTHHTDYADAALKLATFEPEEWLQRIVESHTQVAFRDRAQDTAMFTWWVFRDFLLDGRPKGVNDSGIISFDGTYKKDAFYLLQAFLRPTHPVLRTTSQPYFLRRGRRDNGIKVYSNRPALRLFVNDVNHGTRANGDYRAPADRRVDNVFYWPAPLRDGLNEVLVTDGAGTEERSRIFYATPTTPATAPADPITDLSASNPGNRPYFVGVPPWSGGPVFYDLDGTADNTFAEVPAELLAAARIATMRTSKAGTTTELRFRVAAGVPHLSVFAIAAPGTTLPAFTPLRNVRWRDDAMDLVTAVLAKREASAGTEVVVPEQSTDYALFVTVP